MQLLSRYCLPHRAVAPGEEHALSVLELYENNLLINVEYVKSKRHEERGNRIRREAE